MHPIHPDKYNAMNPKQNLSDILTITNNRITLKMKYIVF